MSPLPDLVLALRRLDLCRRLGYHRPERRGDFEAWMVTAGTREYRALREDQAWLATLRGPAHALPGLSRLQELVYHARPDVQQAMPLPQNTETYREWFYAHGVAEHELWPLLPEPDRADALAAASHHATPGLARLQAWAAADAAAAVHGPDTGTAHPFGVNLVGYAYGQLGIGEDLRQTALALQAVAVPFAVVDFPPGTGVPQNDRSVAAHVVEEGPYAINLFCMTALETGRFYAERGMKQFRGRYNIGYWPWELSRWPDDWKLTFDLVDEVWVSSTHIRDTLRSARGPAWSKPLHVMPLVVEVGGTDVERLREAANRSAVRKRFGLPLAARLFCFSFDLNSSIHRKNPQAVVQAFVRAFPVGEYSAEQVGLVVKVQVPRRSNRAWEGLKALAAIDSRIRIVEGALPRADVLALYAACDCFVSLHRAEGFGRGLAEALQLGLHLIATDYSGNTDYCRRPEFAGQVTPVPYRLVKVRPGQYPYAEGQVWASPSIAAAAKAMRRLVDEPPGPVQLPRGSWPCFSAAELGQRCAARLRALQRERSA